MTRWHEQHQLTDLAVGDLLQVFLNVLEVRPIPGEIGGNVVQPLGEGDGPRRRLFPAEHLTPRLLEQGVAKGVGLRGSRHWLTKRASRSTGACSLPFTDACSISQGC